ncbi:HutD family protein [Streptomyces sp. NPDC008150]|uniref:HutD/Ves family protein n=1 Tax=Streptomyces sp. NPDC008150 TaxID=3364816 RepID=UPI0036E02A5F
MTPRVLRADDRKPAPWKNGGGVTSEVAAYPAGAGTDDFLWRISVADVERGGPFSTFPGVDRIITVVDGPGMELTVDEVAHRVDAPYEPFAFSGDAATECRLLGGPVVDFNVMVRRSAMSARVRVVRTDTFVRPDPGTRVLAVVLDGTAVLRQGSVHLGRLDGILLPAEDAHRHLGQQQGQGRDDVNRLDAGGEDGADFGVEGVLAIVDLVPLPGR